MIAISDAMVLVVFSVARSVYDSLWSAVEDSYSAHGALHLLFPKLQPKCYPRPPADMAEVML
jgi:hypothetical protein